ncbi:MAG: TetR family transcriptional regulator C-terminal domain-containing protein [Zoogloea sp.]|uniref:TetR/AcrR family transcriptional regulator n=1 Tax=Zoogloea sp. TaxID=49181 RepID=UPI0026032DF1|nr:TetR/AcrR family transcriptional regulator [Zoogloea sp.]MDD2988431.1 TetR family transcriptional regulator C-terminal domain-containing protein [Zoogloea sp.]
MSRQPDITRACILDAAFAEIHREGFRAASVANILAATGLTKGAFYHHFPSKKALGLAVIDERIAPLLDDWVVRPLDDGPPSSLSALLDLLERGRSADASAINLGCPLNNLMQEMSALDEDFRAHLGAILECWLRKLTALLLRAQVAGEIRADVDCEVCALFIVAAWEGAVSVSKNLQSAAVFHATMAQLRTYVESLRPRR